MLVLLLVAGLGDAKGLVAGLGLGKGLGFALGLRLGSWLLLGPGILEGGTDAANAPLGALQMQETCAQ